MLDLDAIQFRMVCKGLLLFGLGAAGLWISQAAGLERSSGLWLWAAGMSLSIHFLFVSELKPYFKRPEIVYGFEVLLWLAGAACYFFPEQVARLANWLG